MTGFAPICHGGPLDGKSVADVHWLRLVQTFAGPLVAMSGGYEGRVHAYVVGDFGRTVTYVGLFLDEYEALGEVVSRGT
jgi:hypothetical protein